jgi:hypothetical protein
MDHLFLDMIRNWLDWFSFLLPNVLARANCERKEES